MKHLTDIKDIEWSLSHNSLCLFFIKAPDCGVCDVMLERVRRLADNYPSVFSFYTDILEEPLIAGRFLVFSGPTVLLLMDGKEIYRSSGFINMEELEIKMDRQIEHLNSVRNLT
jgi:thiol-disulfide isomerase/thioredoxin